MKKTEKILSAIFYITMFSGAIFNLLTHRKDDAIIFLLLIILGMVISVKKLLMKE